VTQQPRLENNRSGSNRSMRNWRYWDRYHLVFCKMLKI